MSSQNQDKRNPDSQTPSERSQPNDRNRSTSPDSSRRGPTSSQSGSTKSDDGSSSEERQGSSTPRKDVDAPDRNKIHYGDTEPNDPRESGVESEGGPTGSQTSRGGSRGGSSGTN